LVAKEVDKNVLHVEWPDFQSDDRSYILNEGGKAGGAEHELF